MADMPDERTLKKLLDDVVADVRAVAPQLHEEAAATAEKLGKAPPRKGDFDMFGIAVFTREGAEVAAGNSQIRFPIQSISKLFALEVVLAAISDRVWKHLGREPSGDPFNSIIDLERDKGIPRNPFVNAGALVVCDLLVGLGGKAGPNRHVVKLIEKLLDDGPVRLDSDVMKSDRTHGDLNRSLMFMAKHYGNLDHPVEKVMDAYVHQCAISLDCRGLAKAGRFLMESDAKGREERSIADARRARRIMGVMMLCGLYDGSGDFAYRVGLPAKSGVGGGILAIAPHHASIAVYSPALDPLGNSLLGTLGLEMLTDRIDWSVFGSVTTRD